MTPQTTPTPTDALHSLLQQLKHPEDVQTVVQWWSQNMAEFTTQFQVYKEHEELLAQTGRFDEYFHRQIHESYSKFAEACYNNRVGIIREIKAEPDEKGPGAFPWWERERRFQIRWYIFKPRGDA